MNDKRFGILDVIYPECRTKYNRASDLKAKKGKINGKEKVN